jgi:putative transposase
MCNKQSLMINMTELFKNRYRVPSARAAWWNYGDNGAYFITICTENRQHFFGRISDKKMIMTKVGNCAHECWMKIPEHFPFVRLGEFVVMPNHVHGIVIINKTIMDNNIKSFRGMDHANSRGDDVVGGENVAETQNFASLQMSKQPPNKTMNHFGPQSRNLGSIIRGYKSGVSKYCTQNGILFGWQSRYHDHIIRDRIEFDRISNYILNNPINWKQDVHHTWDKNVEKKDRL